MFLIDGFRRRRRIRELEKILREAWKSAKMTYSEESDDDVVPELEIEEVDYDEITGADNIEAYYEDITRKERFELDMLQQGPLIEASRKWGIDIPPEYLDHEEGRMKGLTLTYPGQAWVRRELSKRRREWAKDWVAIVSPILSAIIAILGLVVALQKR